MFFQVQTIQRDGREVDIKYIVIDNNRTLLAKSAAEAMNVYTTQTMSKIIGYDVSILVLYVTLKLFLRDLFWKPLGYPQETLAKK